jgi:hypothetical protein
MNSIRGWFLCGACAALVFMSSFFGLAAESPSMARGVIEIAEAQLKLAQKPLPGPPKTRPAGWARFQTPKPTNTAADFAALLKTFPETFAPRMNFSEIVEADGWFIVSLDSPDYAAKPSWIMGVIARKGTSEAFYFNVW